MSEYGTTWGLPGKVERYVRRHPGDYLRTTDLGDVPPAVASKALSALARKGIVTRVRKGVYYVPKPTLVGLSKPTAAATAQAVLEGHGRPTGITAAQSLGLTTQMSAREERVVHGWKVPDGTGGTTVALRRGKRTFPLPESDAALLEVLRVRARDSELSPEATVDRLRTRLSPQSRRVGEMRLLRTAALGEPPRVRAMLGALWQSSGWPESLWRPLMASLNPLSRFDFGVIRVLPNARDWQAK